MTTVELYRWAQNLNGALDTVLLIQILRYGLTRRYCWLFIYFLVDALQVLLVINLSTSSDWYVYFYFGGQGAKAFLGVALAIRLWKLALIEYPALARFGRQVVVYMLLAAMSVAVAGLFLQPAARPGRNPMMHVFRTIEGAVDSLVLAFLVAEVLFLLWFPVKVRRNVAVCLGGFVFYWFERWAGLLLVNLYPRNAQSLSAAMVVLSLACLTLLIWGVRREGESVTTVTGHRWDPEETEHLLGQLDAINARLDQMAR